MSSNVFFFNLEVLFIYYSLSEQLKDAQGNKDTIVDDTKDHQEYLESLLPQLGEIQQV